MPEEHIIEAFEELTEIEFIPVEFISYFEMTYIGIKRGRRKNRDEPMFSRKLWNVHNRVLRDLPRTNNAVESFNSTLQSSVGAYNPNIWKLILALQKEESLVQAKVTHIKRGEEPKRKKKNISLDKRIKVLVEKYNPEDKLTFLRSIAHNLITFVLLDLDNI